MTGKFVGVGSDTSTYKYIHDPIEIIDRSIAEGLDTWEAMVQIAADDEIEMAERRWRQGDLALRVEKQYGGEMIVKFASAINVPTSTVKQRRQMSAFYQKDTRYLFENIGYTHYRAAMALGDDALWALRKASMKDWPAWKFELLVKRLLGKSKANKPILDTTADIARRYPQSDGDYIVMRVPRGMAENITIMRNVRFILKTMEAA